jgi:hypothetical protein
MRNILIIVFTLFALNVFSQGRFGTNGDLEPTGNYGIIKASNLRGGYYAVYDTFARNNLPALRRDTGQLVYTTKDNKFWQLTGGIANSNWSAFTFGGAALTDGLVSVDSIRATDSLEVTIYATDTTPTVWRINSVNYSFDRDSVFAINAATTGYFRKDIIVGDNKGNY